jgi:hypothetical protein
MNFETGRAMSDWKPMLNSDTVDLLLEESNPYV